MINRNNLFNFIPLVFIILFIAPTKGFSQLKGTKESATMPMLHDSLEKQLVNKAFGDYFYYPVYDETLGKIWDSQDGPELLHALIRDSSASTLARLVACETLFNTDLMYIQPLGPEIVAEVYCKALEEDVTGMSNSWGLLWENDDYGPQGTQIVAYGKYSVPFLIKLLDNDSLRDNYEGSEEATVGNGAMFRVKDFAAYYLSKINQIPMEYYRDHKDRDKEIEKMLKELQKKK